MKRAICRSSASLRLAVVHAVDDERAVVVELAAEGGVDDLLQRVERFGAPAEQRLAAFAGNFDADAVAQSSTIGTVERQAHRRRPSAS